MAQPLTQLEANRLRQSLGAKLAKEATRRGVAADPVRKQYIFTIFLSRIFQNHDAPWVLLGGITSPTRSAPSTNAMGRTVTRHRPATAT